MIEAKKPSTIMTYLRGHKRALKEGFVMPWQNPIKSLMTIFTLAICFYIPLFLWTLWLNYDDLKQSWQNQGSIAIFLNENIDSKQANILLQEIREHKNIESADLISAQKVKSDLAQDIQFTQIMEQINIHDLPKQILVKVLSKTTIKDIEFMLNGFRLNPQIQYISYDRQWLMQLQALTNTLLQMARISALMFLLIIMVILGNTIANEASKHKSELRLLELIGASWAQVRRSFLYMGTFLGIYAGLLAIGLLSISLWWFADKISTLSQSFGGEITMHNLSINQTIFVILTAVIITWLTARLTLSIQTLNQTQD